ncbi:MAG: restriction endonuclease subunit S [Gammaproteobacteria bacterium]|nr:restriction endonuclease subunit S [Gammaproteobacteria bacterium]
MAPAIDLRPDHRKIVEDILHEHLPAGVRVWVFGSRAEWTTKDSSDLDLALEGDGPLDTRILIEIELALDESLLPFRVDVVDLAQVDERFRDTVFQGRIALMGSAKQCLDDYTQHSVSELIEAGVLEIGDGYRAKNSELASSGLPFARAANVKDGFRFEDADFFPEASLDRAGTRVSQVGDVAFTSKGTVGRVAFVLKGTPRFVYAPQVCYWRSLDHGQVVPRFLYCWMRGEDFRRQLNAVSGQTDMADFVSLRDQRQMRMALPTPPEQRAIASVLGALDDRIELNRRTNETLEAMARALFKSWFVDFDPVRAKMEGRDTGLPREISEMFPDELADSEIGMAPAGWELRRLGELATITRGRSYRSEDLVAAQTALVTLKSFHRGGGYRPDGLKPYRGAYRAEQVVTPGEIIVACTDVTQAADIIGRSAVVLPSSTYATLVASLDVLILRPSHERMKRSFLYHLTSSTRFVSYTYAYTTGTTVLHLDSKSIPEFLFPLPPMELVHHFDDHVSSLLRRVAVDSPSSDVLPAIRDALLPNLVSGGLRLPAPVVSALGGKRTESSVANAELPSR